MRLTPEQFNKEVCDLRKAWGFKDFWADQNKIDAAFHALSVCYFNTRPDEKSSQEDLAIIYAAHVREFNMRADMLGKTINVR